MQENASTSNPPVQAQVPLPMHAIESRHGNVQHGHSCCACKASKLAEVSLQGRRKGLQGEHASCTSAPECPPLLV